MRIKIRKTFSGRPIWVLASKINSENWKCPIFDSLQSKGLTKYQKILLGDLIKCRNFIEFLLFHLEVKDNPVLLTYWNLEQKWVQTSKFDNSTYSLQLFISQQCLELHHAIRQKNCAVDNLDCQIQFFWTSANMIGLQEDAVIVYVFCQSSKLLFQQKYYLLYG